MNPRNASVGHRVLIAAPYGRDAESVAAVLGEQGYTTQICNGLQEMAQAISDPVGALVLTEEALSTNGMAAFDAALSDQPPWSDIPLVVLVARRTASGQELARIRLALPQVATNVVILERPLGAMSLVSAVASAMRARQKQFETRDRLLDLAAQRARLDTLLEALPVGVSFSDVDGTMVLSNPAFRRFVPDGALPSRSTRGEEVWEGYAADGHRLKRDEFAAVRALKGEIVGGIEFRYHPPDGDPVWTRVSGIPLRDEGGSVVGAISVIIDIDEQKKGQESLRRSSETLEATVQARTAALAETLAELRAETAERARAEAALRQSQKMEAVGQLTGGIAHDFNNMLTGVIGSIDIMKRRLAAGRYEDLDRFMEAAASSAKRAAGLTERLLAFSRRQSLDSRPVAINALIQSVEDLLARTIGERIALEVATHPSAPICVADANQLENAVLNLAINARDAMPDGGRLLISTDAVLLCEEEAGELDIPPGRYVTVSVADTGVGIESSILDKVFDPFFTTKPIGQGTGLGLSMIYGFAKQSGGAVRITSAPGAGTEVRLYLPQADALQEPAPDSAIEVRLGDGQRVLVIEDDDSVRLLVCDVLGELGYEAVAFARAMAAIPVLEGNEPVDLMISDVGLPDMNGRQLAEVARKHRPDLPILLVTGYAENAAIRADFLTANMAMITKPFTLEHLSTSIEDMLLSRATRAP